MSVVEGVKEKWDKFSSYKEYDEFTNLWLRECKRILKKMEQYGLLVLIIIFTG